MSFNRECLTMLLDTADCFLATLYENAEFTDRVLWSSGQAYHLTLENDNPDAKITLTAITFDHCLNLF